MSGERVQPGKHLPECDTNLGPDFEVSDGVVRMTIFACMGCLPAPSDREEQR